MPQSAVFPGIRILCESEWLVLQEDSSTKNLVARETCVENEKNFIFSPLFLP